MFRFVFTRSRTARPGRNQNSPPLSQFALRANLTGVGVVFLHRPTTLFTPPFQRPIHSHLPPLSGAPHPHHSLVTPVSHHRAPLSTARAVSEIRRNFAKSVVFREGDFGRGQKRCWFFLSVTKNFRAELLLEVWTPFLTFLFPSRVVAIISGPMNPEALLFRSCPAWDGLSASSSPIHL